MLPVLLFQSKSSNLLTSPINLSTNIDLNLTTDTDEYLDPDTKDYSYRSFYLKSNKFEIFYICDRQNRWPLHLFKQFRVSRICTSSLYII